MVLFRAFKVALSLLIQTPELEELNTNGASAKQIFFNFN